MRSDKQYAEDFEEGDECPLVVEGSADTPCPGKLEYGAVENCGCHISPPCSRCVDNPLTCNVCGWEVEDLEL